MDREQIALRVRQIVGEVANDLGIDSVQPEHSLDHFGFDSLDRVELLNWLEDDLGVRFPHPQDRDLSSPTTTVRDLIEAVERLLSAKGIHA